MKKNILTLLILPLVLLGLFSNQTKALPISPPKYYIDLKGDEELKQELTLFGKEELGATTQRVYLYVVGMNKVGEENDREFYRVDPNDKSQVANWINLSITEVTLEKGKEIKVPWAIKKLSDAKCGTNLAAIVAANAPRDPDEEVALKNEVISQVHVNITQVGDRVCENVAKLSLVDFKIKDDKKMFGYPDVSFVTRIQNNGDAISRSPSGTIDISGFGSKVSLPFNEQNLDIYSNTTRKFDNTWLDRNYPKDANFLKKLVYEFTHLRIGKYKASLAVTKNSNPRVVGEVSFWIIPWRVILTLVLVLLIVTLLIIRSIIRGREFKRLKNESKKL